jgi:dolichyl-phosphate beta-glucosyltransferase
MSNSSTDNVSPEPPVNANVATDATGKSASKQAQTGSSASGAAARRGAVTSQPVTCYLSLIIPAYNEEQRLPATLTRISEYLALRDFSYEIVVVDDGSRDGTRDMVREFAATRPFVRLECYDDEKGRPLNRGKGYAVRHGVLAARGRDILFSDADLSTPIEEMEKLLPPISRGDCDVAIASRALPESNLTVHQPWYRERMGRLFNSIVQRVIDTKIVDTQCGFKAFRGDVAKRLFGMAQIEGFGFDTEILFLAQKFKYRVREMPVTWEHRDDSRVSPLSAPFQMLSEVMEVRLNDIRGLYDEDAAPGSLA